MIPTRPSGSGAGLAIGLAFVSVALSAAPRVLLAAGTLPASARPFVWSDVLATYVERLGGTALPYFDAFFEYPPLIGYISGVLVRATHDPVAYMIGWAIVCAVAAGAIAALIARETGTGRAVLLWSLSPQLLLYGAMNFDLLAVALLVTAMFLGRSGQRLGAMVTLALGTLTKAFPALAAPLEIDRTWRRHGLAAAVASAATFSVTLVAIALPGLAAAHPVTEGIAYVAGLTNPDSAWGLVLATLSGVGLPGAERIVALASAAGMGAMYVWTLKRRDEDVLRATALALLGVLLWTRLFSPQYSLWVLPFYALVPIGHGPYALLCAADVLLFVTIYPLTLVPWQAVDPLPSLLYAGMAIAVVLRHVALIWTWRRMARLT